MASEEKRDEQAPTHIDDWVQNPDNDAYARWMFMHFRLPALMHATFNQFIADRKLFCTYEGKRFRVTGASRLGDVWLAENFERDMGYDHRVTVDTCSKWSGSAEVSE